MPRTVPFLLGLLLGGGAGASLAHVLAPRSTEDAGQSPGAAGTAPVESRRETPVLHGRDPTGAAGAKADNLFVAATGTTAEFEKAGVEAALKQANAQEAIRLFWLGLVMSYAGSGRLPDTLRACDRALEAGAPAALVLPIFRPDPPSLEALMRRHPAAGWSLNQRLEVADPKDTGPLLAALRIVRERAAAAASGAPVPMAPEGEVNAAELLRRLAALDLRLALAEAEALTAGDGSALPLTEVARALRAHPTAAVPFLQRTLAASPLDADAVTLLMDLDRAAATSHLEGVIARDPSLADAWTFLGGARAQADDPTGAAEAYTRAAALDPTYERLHELVDIDAQAGLRALARATAGQAATDATVWELRARTELQAGDQAVAMDTWLRTLEIDPTQVLGQDEFLDWVRLDPARTASRLESRVERAFAAGDDDLLVGYAAALVEAKDPRASAHCRRLVERGIWWQGSPWLLARADPAAAVPLLEANRGKSPYVDVEVLTGLGEAYLGVGRQADAAAAFDTALSTARQHGWYDGPTWVGLARAHPDGLRRLEAHAATLDPAYGAALLGDAYAALGRTADAKAAYDRALEHDPENTQWRARRAALR